MKTLLRLFLFTVAFLMLSNAKAQDIITRHAPLPCIDKTFTIVAHIVRDQAGAPNIDEATILSNLNRLNADFSPICVSFEICEFRYIDNYQYDVMDNADWEEMQTLYHVPRRINMYFVEDTGLDACGFASLGAIVNLTSGGIVIKKEDCVGGGAGTLSHEMGHFFGLRHTFDDVGGEELVDGSNCETAGDGICDTPADPFVEEDLDILDQYVDVENGCRFIWNAQDTNGEYYSPIVGNVMSYYQNDCSCGFTHGQLSLMANTFLASPNMW